MRRALAGAFRRFATGIYLLWFPVKSRAEADGFCGEVLAAGARKALRLTSIVGAPSDARRADIGGSSGRQSAVRLRRRDARRAGAGAAAHAARRPGSLGGAQE